MLIGWDKAVKDLSENDDVIARIIAKYPYERMEKEYPFYKIRVNIFNQNLRKNGKDNFITV